MAIKQRAKISSKITARCALLRKLPPVFFGSATFIAALISPAASSGTFEFSADNDSMSGKDREYSSGVFLRWSDTLAAAPAHLGYSLVIGSQIWT
ncbi:MAG: lipid A-modifier LpxR family protein, partial [Enterovibrio sp.]